MIFSILCPLIVTGTGPDIGEGGKMNTKVLAFQQVVGIAGTPFTMTVNPSKLIWFKFTIESSA